MTGLSISFSSRASGEPYLTWTMAFMLFSVWMNSPRPERSPPGACPGQSNHRLHVRLMPLSSLPGEFDPGRQASLQRAGGYEPRPHRRNFGRHLRGRHDPAGAGPGGTDAERSRHGGRPLAGAAAAGPERTRVHDEFHDSGDLLGRPGHAAQSADTKQSHLLVASAPLSLRGHPRALLHGVARALSNLSPGSRRVLAQHRAPGHDAAGGTPVRTSGTFVHPDGDGDA